MEIENIIIAKYFELQDRKTYDYIINYSTDSKDLFNIGDFTNLTFGVVKDMQYKFNKGIGIKSILEFISNHTEQELSEIGKTNFMDFVKAFNYIKKQIEFINTIEENSLVGVMDADAEQAGVDRFDKYGYWIQIDKLAGGDPLKYEAVKNLTYLDCHTKLYYEVEKEDYNSTLNKIRNRKHGKV